MPLGQMHRGNKGQLIHFYVIKKFVRFRSSNEATKQLEAGTSGVNDLKHDA